MDRCSTMDRSITRRAFLKAGLAGLLIGAGSSIRSARAGTHLGIENASPPRTRVVIVGHPGAADEHWHIDESIVRKMVDHALLEWSGESSLQNAWAKVLPGLKDTDLIGIKVNCINLHLSTHPSVVRAIIGGLKTLGVPESQILIWDRRKGELERAGFELNHGPGVRCFGTDSDGIGYDEEESAVVEGHRIKLSRILTGMCDHLINVPVLKDHKMSGVTLSLKNHYGSIPLLDDLPWSALTLKRLHAHNGDPQIAHLNAAPAIRDKTRLIVCDALSGIYNGGPSGAPQWANRQILVGDDPVAVDYHGMQIIEDKRKEQGLESVARKAGHIHTAAKMGLGTDNPEQIDTCTTRIM